MLDDKYLVVGIGNVGKTYENNRHNIGYEALKFFAKNVGVSFKRIDRVGKCKLAECRIGDKKVILLLPLTFVNNTGEAVIGVVNYFGIEIDNVFIVVDDVYLDFGMFRLKKSGSSGGHNGLKSIEGSLGTQDYLRLRVGVGLPNREDLSKYVLSNFNIEESGNIPDVMVDIEEIINKWIVGGIDVAMEVVSKKNSKDSKKFLGED